MKSVPAAEDCEPCGTHLPRSERDDDHRGAQAEAREVRKHQRAAAQRHAVRPRQVRLGPAQPQQRQELEREGQRVQRHVQLDELLEGQDEAQVDAQEGEEQRGDGRLFAAVFVAKTRRQHRSHRHRLHSSRRRDHEGVEQPCARTHARGARPHAQPRAPQPLRGRRERADVECGPRLEMSFLRHAADEDRDEGRREHHHEGQHHRARDGLWTAHLRGDERDGIETRGGPKHDREKERDVGFRHARRQDCSEGGEGGDGRLEEEEEQHECEGGEREDGEDDGGARGEGDAAQVEQQHDECEDSA
mmetsp:Transcript_29817/g.74540  ORF Transcript_29817/g.74540 Transcript_29817/m.74540 type:complete len:303 (+) Transcript_29817:524-1432(+)